MEGWGCISIDKIAQLAFRILCMEQTWDFLEWIPIPRLW